MSRSGDPINAHNGLANLAESYTSLSNQLSGDQEAATLLRRMAAIASASQSEIDGTLLIPTAQIEFIDFYLRTDPEACKENVIAFTRRRALPTNE